LNWDSVVNMCINFPYGSDSEQRTHEFIHVYLVFASAYVWIGIETTDEGTKILATVDGKSRNISESSIRRNLKLNDEAGISSLLDAELFKNLALMGVVVCFNEFSSNIATAVGEGLGTPTEPHHTPSPEAQQSPQHDLSSSIHLPVTTAIIPTVIPTEIPTLRQYSRRVRIAQSSALPTASDEPASLLGDDSQEEAFLTGSMQQQLQELTNLCTRLQRHQTKMAFKITDQDLEITSLKARIKILENNDGGGAEPSGEDATLKGRSLDTREEAGVEKSTKRGNVASVSVPTGSGIIPTASLIFTTASVVTPYSRQKDQTRSEQIARDAEIARIHAEEELQMLIDGLDRNNETIAKYLQEYEQFAADLSIGEKIDMINEQVKYQDHYAKVLKYQAQQRKPLFKKQQREFYMSVLKSHSGWKTKHFKGMSLEEIREKFIPVWKQIEDFVPMASKEDGERFKRKGLSIIQATSDKEKELWVELKRLYEPDIKDQLWTHTQALMHDPVEWRLYDTCGVHHVLSRDQEIFMLVEKDYPLRKGLTIMMISNKLQVENYS
nr:hypothetical protein [Tanacetum cinerariifolium]